MNAASTRKAKAEAARAQKARQTAALQTICTNLGVDVAEVLGPSRAQSVVAIRRKVVVRLRELGWSYPEIGALLGRHHTSIMYLAKTGDK